MIVGLFLQQAIALFVLKSGAGFHIFNWIATLASDFLAQALVGAGFFFDAETVSKHWFFVNTVRCLKRDKKMRWADGCPFSSWARSFSSSRSFR